MRERVTSLTWDGQPALGAKEAVQVQNYARARIHILTSGSSTRLVQNQALSCCPNQRAACQSLRVSGAIRMGRAPRARGTLLAQVREPRRAIKRDRWIAVISEYLQRVLYLERLQVSCQPNPAVTLPMLTDMTETWRSHLN